MSWKYGDNRPLAPDFRIASQPTSLVQQMVSDSGIRGGLHNGSVAVNRNISANLAGNNA
jgi:hypothetical protein